MRNDVHDVPAWGIWCTGIDPAGIFSSHSSTRVPHPALLDLLTRVPDSSPFVGRAKRPLGPLRPLTGCGSLRKGPVAPQPAPPLLTPPAARHPESSAHEPTNSGRAGGRRCTSGRLVLAVDGHGGAAGDGDRVQRVPRMHGDDQRWRAGVPHYGQPPRSSGIRCSQGSAIRKNPG